MLFVTQNTAGTFVFDMITQFLLNLEGGILARRKFDGLLENPPNQILMKFRYFQHPPN